MIKKESLLDQPKFWRSGSAVWHLFWRLAVALHDQQWHQILYIYIYNEDKHAPKNKTKQKKQTTFISNPLQGYPSHPMQRGQFNIMMSSYQYRKSHCGDKMILQPSYLHSVLSPLWNFLYWLDDIFILNQDPVSIRQPCWWSRSWQSNHFIPGNCTLDPAGIWTMR